MAGKKELKREIESAVLFALAKEPEAGLLQKIEHWPEVGNFISSRKLAGRFYQRVKENHLFNLIPEPALENLKQFYHLTAIKNKILFKEMQRVCDQLKSPEINLILLKGASLILRRVFQPGERYQNDLDFLLSGMDRDTLKETIFRLGYLSVQHSDQQDWSEANFKLSEGKSFGDAFSVFLEFHWTFRPLNYLSGEKLAKDILNGSEAIGYDSRTYQIPRAELQFYQAGLHGCAHHPFDSGYFWVSLMDLSALASSLKLNYRQIINFAEDQGLAQNLGVMSYLMAEKLHIFPEFWQELASRSPKLKPLIEQTGQAIWWGFLNPRPISLIHIIYLFSPTEAKNKRNAFLELTGLRKRGEQVQVNGVPLTSPRPRFFALLASRLRILDWDFLKLIWQTAKFCGKVKVYFPWGG